jgi:ribose transport system ATP-binding protein
LIEDPQHVGEREVIRMIAGREVDQLEARPTPSLRADARVELEVRSLRVGRQIVDLSMHLREGEVLGIAALEGSGQRELFLALFGAVPLDAGTVLVHGRPVRIRSPREAVAAGLALVPEDRKAGGLLLDSSLVTNVSLASLSRFSRLGLFRSQVARRRTLELLSALAVKYTSADDRAGALSGGNQQKVVLAKWLAAESRVFLMYDPTRGVDPATKLDMYSRIRELADQGRSILFYSSEIEEVLNLSTRILVMYRGKIVRAYSQLPVSEEEVVSAMLGMALDRV